jgi:hypothetical protein
MLSTPVYLYNPVSLGAGQYSIELYFDPSAMAKYLRVGDIIRDAKNDQYLVTTWSGFSADNGDGNTVVTQFLSNNVLPQESTVFYDGVAFTPGQDDLRPAVHTEGSISSISVYSGQNFEYAMSGSWVSSVEANKAVVGDHVLDRNGKSYKITFIDSSNRFDVPFRAVETEKVGIIPPDGAATLYRPTANNELFRGVNINILAETAIRNRDTTVLDKLTDYTEPYINDQGSTITQNQIVFESSAGKVQLASASSALSEGTTFGVVAAVNIAHGDTGNIYVRPGLKISGLSGLIPGSPVYLSRTVPGGFQTSLTGFVAGEHVVKLGTAVSTTELLFFPEYDFEF